MAPSPAEKVRLTAEFERIFATVTGYQQLDDRIAKTQLKQASLLLVLEHPEIPLHNNPAELGARQRVRERDVSFGPQTADGAQAWDTFQTLTATAQKLGMWSSFTHSFNTYGPVPTGSWPNSASPTSVTYSFGTIGNLER